MKRDSQALSLFPTTYHQQILPKVSMLERAPQNIPQSHMHVLRLIASPYLEEQGSIGFTGEDFAATSLAYTSLPPV